MRDDGDRPIPGILLLAALLWVAALLLLALSPQLGAILDTWFSAAYADVGLHALGLGLQAVLLYLIVRRLARPLVAVAVAWLGTTALGLAVELLQLELTRRNAELKDVLADMLGAGLALLLCLAATRTAGALRALRAGGHEG